MNRFNIVDAMLNRKQTVILGVHDSREVQLYGYVNGVAMEDGSGYNLLVDVVTHGGKRYNQVFVRCER